MATRVPFLNTAYGAYHHRERPKEDEELTRVGPGTPCGEYLRRFWHPIISSEELQDLPRRLRILGEEMFRPWTEGSMRSPVLPVMTQHAPEDKAWHYD